MLTIIRLPNLPKLCDKILKGKALQEKASLLLKVQAQEIEGETMMMMTIFQGVPVDQIVAKNHQVAKIVLENPHQDQNLKNLLQKIDQPAINLVNLLKIKSNPDKPQQHLERPPGVAKVLKETNLQISLTPSKLLNK